MSKETIARRFDEAGLSERRFVAVKDGEKKCVDHDTRYSDPRDVPGQNYGIYANEGDRLVAFDVDYHREGSDDVSPVALGALSGLPATLKLQSPHVPREDDRGGHDLYKLVGDEKPAELFERVFGTKNPVPSWGEVIAKNKYIVAPGSQLDDCAKDWCTECAKPDGGWYTIKKDRPIAEVDPDTVVEALRADPDLGEKGSGANQTLDGVDAGSGADTASGTKTPSGRDYDDLDRETVEEALETLPGTQHFDDWTDTLYAVYDWDDGETGKEVAKSWSQTNAKWEADDSQYQIDYIWKKGESGDSSNNIGVGTLVHKAKENGWTPPWAERAPSYDEEEVNRGADLLAAESSPEDPAGEMDHRNGHYGYWWEKTNDAGEVVERNFDAVTNFTLETLEHLKTDGGDLLKLRVHPANPMGDEYDVDVHPTVFNETRAFKEEIVRGRTTRYEPGKRNQQALNDLRETVGTQTVPKRVGVEHIGLAGDDYDEWVSPKGTLTADGAADDPAHRYYAKGGTSDSDGGALARKWLVDPETMDDYDADDVARIVELLPQTRRHDRGLPILGWFYAAPLRPLIHGWEGEFNLLQVVGATGTGKTSTLKSYWEAFGMEPDPFSASATPFTLMKHMSSSSGVPVWIDEYKPADIRSDRLDTLHRRLREVTKGGSVSKGQANLGEVLFTLKAPVIVSGEQKFSQSVPAVRRRSVMTTLSEEPTREGTDYTRAFSELTGTPYEDEDGTPQYPGGYDLTDHARAYYRYILGLSEGELREVWNSARERTADMLSARGLTLQKTEFQGAQTILFGVRLFRAFAEEIGADASALPTDDEVADAFEHYASNIGKDGKRLGYDDAFLELFAQAASEGYLERGEDFRFIDSQKWGSEVLVFHMPTANAEVRRYVREYNLDDEYTLVGKSDYLSAFRDKSERESSHVKAVNHRARLEGGPAKCVVIDPDRTREALGSAFDLRAFGKGDDDGEDVIDDAGDGGDGDGSGGGSGPFADAKRMASVSPSDGYTTITATVTAVNSNPNPDALRQKATLTDRTDKRDAIAWASERDEPLPIEMDESYTFTDVKGGTDNEGAPQIVFTSDTEVKPIQPGAGYTEGEARADGQSGLDAAADGGETVGADGGGTASETEDVAGDKTAPADPDPETDESGPGEKSIQKAVLDWLGDETESGETFDYLEAAGDDLLDGHPPDTVRDQLDAFVRLGTKVADTGEDGVYERL